ncbi:MAG: RDD family protein [Candidatus Aminicenantes bacterium]|nr:RDD family protein [Candidatus Aminicenantes bacterium]
MIQKHKAHPEQAGFFKRFLAFMIDNLIIMLISLIVFFSLSEIAAARRGEKGEFSRMLNAIKSGEAVVVGVRKNSQPAEAENRNNRGGKTYFVGGEKFNILFEFFIGYIYYVLFFRSGGRTPGKRLLRLRVIDLKGRQRLGWYQSLERAHGYAASTLLAFLGFLQVLWDHEGLTMHDKLAGTTVIRIKKEFKGGH